MSFIVWMSPKFCCKEYNFLPNDKILDWTKLKAFAEDKLDITKIMNSVCDRVENIEGKKEKMLVTSIFSFFHNVFKRNLPQSR